MAEIEKEEEIIEEEEILEENNQDGDDSEEISYEQALEWKQKAESLEKAEKKIVDLKKANKTIIKKDVPINSKEEVKKIMAEERFYEKNPDAESYREKIEEYQKNGLLLDDAYVLASRKDKEIEKNREIYWESFVKWEAGADVISSVSLDTFDKMTPKAQADYSDKMINKYWKIKFK